MKFLCSTLLFFLISVSIYAQNTPKRALFIGNSYTYFNNLPELTARLALSAGDSLLVDDHLVGGWSLQLHAGNKTSVNKIKAGNWDFVALQEYSRLPSFPIALVDSLVFPYAHFLDSLVNEYSPCGETIFYMTWGRKNGNSIDCANIPSVCTYQGMDSLTRLRYEILADTNQAILSPVGAVWRYLRENHPNLELYTSDGSHPSLLGSYAAACSFYSVIFRKDPMLITYDTTVSLVNAAIIRNAAKLVVFDSLALWNVGKYDPISNYNFSVKGNEISFTNTSINAESYVWDFGDGDSSTLPNPSHTYQVNGVYRTKLISSTCALSDSMVQSININVSGLSEEKNNLNFTIYPNPANDQIMLKCNNQLIKSFTLFNYQGIKLKENEVNSFDLQIFISDLPVGLYFIKIVANDNSIGIKKFLKE